MLDALEISGLSKLPALKPASKVGGAIHGCQNISKVDAKNFQLWIVYKMQFEEAFSVLVGIRYQRGQIILCCLYRVMRWRNRQRRKLDVLLPLPVVRPRLNNNLPPRIRSSQRNLFQRNINMDDLLSPKRQLLQSSPGQWDTEMLLALGLIFEQVFPKMAWCIMFFIFIATYL